MTDSIGVEIEHVHYALFLDLRKDVENTLDLTTIENNQKKAVIRVYLFTEGKKILLKEILVSPLPPRPAGEIKLTLKGRLDKKRYLRLTVLLGRKQLHTSSADLQKYRKQRSIWWIPVLSIVVLGAAAGIVFGTGIIGKRRAAAQQDTAAVIGEEKAPSAAEKQPEEKEAAEKEPAEVTGPGEEAPEAEAPGAAAQEAAARPAKEVQEAAAEEGPPDIPAETIRRSVYFRPESAALTGEARTSLQQLVRLLNRYEDAKVEIIGHCALFPTELERKTLSIERAETVYSFLVTSGWDPAIPPDIRGLGGERPVTTDQQQQYLNRRVEISILGQEEE